MNRSSRFRPEWKLFSRIGHWLYRTSRVENAESVRLSGRGISKLAQL